MDLAFVAFHVAIMAIAASIFIAAAYSDARMFRIPNYLCGLLLGLFPLFVITAPHGIGWTQNLGLFALVGVTGFAMFLGHLAGAGDVKLLAVASLWAGPHFIAVLLVVTAIVGGVLSIALAGVAVIRKILRGGPLALHHMPIPYGIAIASGGLATLGMMARPILFPG